ncbi:MAG: hypothetical protein ACLQCB_15090 [Spirochaetia bacterium]
MAQPQPQDSSSDGASQKEFVVTPELYNKTFDEVKEVIASLTALINAQDYEGWRSYLTADYVAKTSDPKFLDRASRSGVLQKSGIVLHSLKDYFQNVVVLSRVQATLQDITFVDKTHVKAMSIIDGNPVILYYLVREDDRWKVGIWSSDQD